MTSRVTKQIAASPAAVWAVLADGWLYTNWVVGASRMRTVEGDWPGVDSSLHHSVGAWPAVIDDTTTVVGCQPGERLELRARARPLGVAVVEVLLVPTDYGTEVTLTERVIEGPGCLIPDAVLRPVLDWRNRECLRRLEYLAVGGAD